MRLWISALDKFTEKSESQLDPIEAFFYKHYFPYLYILLASLLSYLKSYTYFIFNDG